MYQISTITAINYLNSQYLELYKNLWLTIQKCYKVLSQFVYRRLLINPIEFLIISV